MAGTEQALEQTITMAISNEMVRVYKERFGRGPTRARTYWVDEDVLLVRLDGTLTPAERTLVRLGEHERLRESRLHLQYATADALCEPVERLTGRRVRAFNSSIDTEADGIAVEVFLLHPPGYERTPGRAPRTT